jgi:Arc/MetJ family transcription regulator
MAILAVLGHGRDARGTSLYTWSRYVVYTKVEGERLAVKLTSIKLDPRLADEAAKVLGVKSRTEAVHVALREIVALKRFKELMRKPAGKLSFAGHGE